MSSPLVQQIAEAVLARIAAIAGIGDTALVPQASVSTWPAVFLLGDEETKQPRTMGATGGHKTCSLDLIWVFYTRDVQAYPALAAVARDIENVIEAAPFNLGVEGVVRPFVKAVKRYNPATSQESGVGEITINVTYNQLYGAA